MGFVHIWVPYLDIREIAVAPVTCLEVEYDQLSSSKFKAL